jgi:capsular exopolysaccharide synthesis family protein
MSRIYEALRRAEKERANGEGQDPWKAQPAAPLAQAVLEPVSETLAPKVTIASEVLVPEVIPGELRKGSGLARGLADPALIGGERVASAPLAPAVIEFGKIAVHTWAPLLERLPSTAERGRTVEQFRSLRSRMQELRNDNPSLKSIMVSSGLPQEGKSFVAVNLAVSLARHKNSRVLLIDGDMRRASLHKVLGCPIDGPGLTEYLAGKAKTEEILQKAKPAADGSPLPPGIGSLVFAGAGAESDKASDLSGNHLFEELVAKLAPHFDWIIVDSSPVNLVADGINLARACDGVLLIAREGVTKLDVAQRAVAELKSSKILGFVLNAVQNAKSQSGYGYYEYAPYEAPEKKAGSPAQK